MPTAKNLYHYNFFDKNIKIKNKADKNKWLNEYILCGSVSNTCKKRKISRTTFYSWLKSDEVFRKAYTEEAKPMITSLLEDEAYRRAVVGVNKSIFYKGNKIATMKVYSDSLLQLLLQANCPEKYKQVVDSTVKTDITVKNENLTDALAERIRKADE